MKPAWYFWRSSEARQKTILQRGFGMPVITLYGTRYEVTIIDATPCAFKETEKLKKTVMQLQRNAFMNKAKIQRLEAELVKQAADKR